MNYKQKVKAWCLKNGATWEVDNQEVLVQAPMGMHFFPDCIHESVNCRQNDSETITEMWHIAWDFVDSTELKVCNTRGGGCHKCQWWTATELKAAENLRAKKMKDAGVNV